MADDSGEDDDYEYDGPRKRKPYTPRIRVAVPKNRENVYGPIPGADSVGTCRRGARSGAKFCVLFV